MDWIAIGVCVFLFSASFCMIMLGCVLFKEL